MGWGDILMGMGEALKSYNETGQRVVFPENRVFSYNINWRQAYQNINYIISKDEIVENEDVVYFEDGKDFTKYIDWNNSTNKKFHFLPYRPIPAELKFNLIVYEKLTILKRRLGEFIFIEPHVKNGVSKLNKDWGFENFQSLVNRVDAKFVQPNYGKPLLKGAIPITTAGFLDAAAILSISKTSVMNEGGLMHAAAAVNIPSVIIFGGYISPNNTGYEMHKNIHVKGSPCGMRSECLHCKKVMDQIKVKKVESKVEALLKR